jgi:Restriction endonuclease
MKAGAEYEQFVYEKLMGFFVDARVAKNDRIRGYESGLEREIDVSVRLQIGDVELLYIVQCKDWASRADIKVLGEFSAVMQDVRAAKGFLLCTAGFAKTNHRYALAKGIELLTIEDIQSDRWKAEVQIPLIYTRKINNFVAVLDIIINEALVEKNRDRELLVQLKTSTPLTTDGGRTTIAFEQHINDGLRRLLSSEHPEGTRMDLNPSGLQIMVADVWVPCKIAVELLQITRLNYLKYLTPTEYSHIRDHVRETILPLHVLLANVGLQLDDTFIELPTGPPPVFAGLWLEVEESNVSSDGTGMNTLWNGASMSIINSS